MFIVVERFSPAIDKTTLDAVSFVDVVDHINNFLFYWLFIQICIRWMIWVLDREYEFEADRTFSIVDKDWNLSSEL